MGGSENDCGGGGGVNGVEEGIEFAIRNNTNGGTWIPLQLDYRMKKEDQDTDEWRQIRGYNVSAFGYASGNRAVINRNVSICGDILDTNTIQLRWMQSSRVNNNNTDVWALAYVSATFIEANETINLINETFGCGSTGECALK